MCLGFKKVLSHSNIQTPSTAFSNLPQTQGEDLNVLLFFFLVKKVFVNELEVEAFVGWLIIHLAGGVKVQRHFILAFALLFS